MTPNDTARELTIDRCERAIYRAYRAGQYVRMYALQAYLSRLMAARSPEMRQQQWRVV